MRSDAERVDDLLARVVPAAATLRERREAPWLEPAADGGGDVDSLWQAWAETATGGDDAALRALLADRGIEPDKARASLGTMRLVPGAVLPRWAGSLRELLIASLDAPPPDDVALAASLTEDGCISISAEASIPVARGFGAHALAGFVAPARGVPGGLTDELVVHLLTQMLLVCLPVLRAGALDAFEPGRPPFDAWAATLEEAPALGRVLGVVAANGRAFSRELLARLRADRDELEPLLGRGRPVSGAGDRHDDGRFVLPVAFEDDRRVLYKPKDLRGGDVLARVLEVLGAPLTLPARLSREDYVWEAFTEEALPSSPAEWADLAREVGTWTCLFDLLGTTDMHVANVRLSGGRLVPVDTETLLSFYFEPTDRLPWLPAGTSSRLISAPMRSRHQAALGDIGVLADPAHRPLLDHLDRALAGYAEMQSRLAGSRESLHAVLDELADVPVRGVVRNTWVYFRLLMLSLEPGALGSGVTRDLVLERLWRAQRRFGLPVAVVQAEVDALGDLDVPLFRFLPGGRDLVGPGGRVAAAALSEAPLNRVRARLDALSAVPDPAELEAVTAQFFAAAANGARDVALSAAPIANELDGAEVDWMTEAVWAGDELLELLQHGGPGHTRLNAGLVYIANNHLFGLSPTRPADLLSGSLGISVALADLARVTGEERFDAEAARQREPAVAALRVLLDDVERWNRTRIDPPPGGLHWGLPAVLYTLLRLPAAGDGSADEDALARAGSVLARFAAGDAYRLGSWFRGTMPSSLLVATSFDLRSASAARARDFAAATQGFREHLASALLSEWERLWPHPRPNPELAALFPSPHALAALALFRHAQSLGRPVPEPVAAWAARFAETDVGESSADRLIAVELGAGLALRERTLPAPSQGCLDLLEEQLAAWHDDGATATLEIAQAAGARILALRRVSGRCFPEAVAPDRFRLSALWGLAAVVRAFAGLAAPEQWHSLRLL